MLKKMTVLLLLVVFSSMCLMPQAVYADGKKMGYDQKEGLEGKFCYKVKFMMKNKEELGLSDKQVAQIKDLKYSTKKELIKQNAEIDLAKLECESKLYEDKLDVAAMDQLIEKKYDLKKAKAKYLVSQYAKLKTVLTDDQMKKMKSMMGKCKCWK